MKLTALLCFLLASAFALAQDSAIITGKITDSAGAIIGTATVKLTPADHGDVRDASISGSTDGRYTFTKLPAANYRLDVTTTSMKPFSTDVTVAAGQKKEVPVRMETICAPETEDYVKSSAIFLDVNENVNGRGRIFTVRISRQGDLEYQGRAHVALGTRHKQIPAADVHALLRSFAGTGFWSSQSCVGEESMNPDVTIIGASRRHHKKAVWIYNGEANQKLLALRDKILQVANISDWIDHGEQAPQ